MTDQEIIALAPERATDIDDTGNYWVYEKSGDCLLWDNSKWIEGFSPFRTRSLKDIKRIVKLQSYNLGLGNESHAQQERIAGLEQQKAMLIIAVESLRQPHMDYIPALDMTGAKLLQTIKGNE